MRLILSLSNVPAGEMLVQGLSDLHLLVTMVKRPVLNYYFVDNNTEPAVTLEQISCLATSSGFIRKSETPARVVFQHQDGSQMEVLPKHIKGSRQPYIQVSVRHR